MTDVVFKCKLPGQRGPGKAMKGAKTAKAAAEAFFKPGVTSGNVVVTNGVDFEITMTPVAKRVPKPMPKKVTGVKKSAAKRSIKAKAA